MCFISASKVSSFLRQRVIALSRWVFLKEKGERKGKEIWNCFSCLRPRADSKLASPTVLYLLSYDFWGFFSDLQMELRLWNSSIKKLHGLSHSSSATCFNCTSVTERNWAWIGEGTTMQPSLPLPIIFFSTFHLEIRIM